MPHPDEGTIHALLDGELDAAEAERVRGHVGECAECLRRYEEAQRFVAESDRAVASLDDVRHWPLEEEDLRAEVEAPPAAGITPGAPVVLMPSASQQPRWERTRSRSYFWAAGIAVLAGAGYLVVRARTDEQDDASRTTIATLPTAATAASDSATRASSMAPPLAAAPAAAVDTPASRPVLLASERMRADQPAPEARQAADRETAPSNTVAAKAAAGQVASLQRAAEPARAEAAAQPAVNDASSPAPAAPPPAPEPTIDTRAQLASRIGLDEVRRELGSALHGIDGLRPKAVGLLPGRLVPGADPARNVVRAVYQDRDGQLFYLDQQRVAGGAAAARGGIVVGDVQLFLHGQLAADSVRALTDRVR